MPPVQTVIDPNKQERIAVQNAATECLMQKGVAGAAASAQRLQRGWTRSFGEGPTNTAKID